MIENRDGAKIGFARGIGVSLVSFFPLLFASAGALVNINQLLALMFEP